MTKEVMKQDEPVSKKWIMPVRFGGIAKFDAEGYPLFYDRESLRKFKSGELSVPCKGKNCGSLNGWLHSAECRAEHEAHYTTTQSKQEQDEPWGTYMGHRLTPKGTKEFWGFADVPLTEGTKLYTKPQPRKPLTDEMIVAGGKALAKLHADTCGLDFDDVWKYYAEDHKADAKAALEAAHGIKE